MYRYVIFFASMFLSVYGKPQGAHVYSAETDCFTQHPSINRDFLEGLKRAKALPDNPTTDFKCFIACVAKSLDLMSVDGDLNHGGLKEATIAITAGDVSHDDAHDMVSKCLVDAGEPATARQYIFSCNEEITTEIWKCYCEVIPE